MDKKKRKPLKPFTVVLRLALVGVAIYFGAALISIQVEISAKRQQLDNIALQIQAQQAVNLELQRTLDSDNEDAYIERVAREKLGYGRPDERVFVDMSGK